MAQCGAKARSGGPCKNAGMANGRCKFHGGASLAGPAHPNWKHGRHSKVLPVGLAQRYATAITDPNLTQLRDEVALVDVRIWQLLETLGQTGNTRLWKAASTAFNQFKAAGGKKGEVVAARVALKQLESVLTEGLTDAATWDELRESLDLRRRLSEAETKRLKDLQQMVPAERAYALMASLIDVVNQHVTDRHTQTAIFEHWRRLVGRPSAPAPEA